MNIKDLLEGIGKRTLYHYTTYYALYKMLQEDKMIAFKYVGTPKGKYQIATVRPSLVNDRNLKELSGGSEGGVKIIFNAEILSDTIRGVKILNIAEVPILHFEDMMKAGKLTDSSLKKLIEKLNKKTKNNFKLKLTKSISNILDEYKIKKKDKFFEFYKEYKRFLIVAREGEERITIDQEYIRLNSKFMKIELVKPYPEDHYLKFKDKLIDQVIENKKYFVENSIHDELIRGKK